MADVVGVIETFDLTDVTLVGHSYGGRVVTRVWGEVGDRIRSMVYVDAHAPVAPEPPEPEGRAKLAADNGGMLPFSEIHVPSEDLVGDVDWFMDRAPGLDPPRSRRPPLHHDEPPRRSGAV